MLECRVGSAGIATGGKMRHSGRGFLRYLWMKRDDSFSFWNLDFSCGRLCFWKMSFVELLLPAAVGSDASSMEWCQAGVGCMSLPRGLGTLLHKTLATPALLYLTHSGILGCFLSSRFTSEESLPFSSPSFSLSIHLTLFIYSVVFWDKVLLATQTDFLRFSSLNKQIPIHHISTRARFCPPVNFLA